MQGLQPTSYTVNLGSKYSYIMFAALSLLALSSIALWAQQTPLQLGSVSSQLLASCPEDRSHHFPLPQAICYDLTVSQCQSGPTDPNPYLPDLDVIAAVSTPMNWNNGPTVVLHTGGWGVWYFVEPEPPQTSYAQAYLNAGFQVIQVAWADDWHDNTNQPPVKSIKFAACRPATLFNYSYTTYHGGASSPGGMCVQGHSAGSTATAYALAWYGAGSYLDNVVLTSGPVYSDVRAGCKYPPDPQFQNPITVCPAGQLGCITGPEGGWLDFTQYQVVQGSTITKESATAVAGYTNAQPANCNDYTGTGTATDSQHNNAWKQMSLVDGSSNPVFSYPQTSVFAFLCATSQQNQQNNSAAQGQLFYSNFTSASQTKALSIFRVDNCAGDEMIWYGQTYLGSGLDVSEARMVNGCIKNH